jgi:hypothetical protein
VAIFQSDQPDAAVEAILRASRPEPDAVWVDRLERRLLKPRRSARSRLTFGFALAAGLAAVAVTFSLIGVSPLSRGSDAVDAREDCRVVVVAGIERVPVLVRDAAGAPRVIYRDRTVTRRVTRCS